MNLRRLGSTDLLVSPIGLGLAALGRPGYINLQHARDLKHNYDIQAMKAQTYQVLDAAWQGDVRYYDAARSYGKAEEFLGAWLKARRIPVESVTVGSKWGYTYTAGWQVDAEVHEVKQHSLSVLRRQWQESKDNLSPYLRLYQTHSATRESGFFENQEVLQELGRLKRDGVVIGLTLSGAEQAGALERAMEIRMDGNRLFDCVQATWNLLEPSLGDKLHQVHLEGMGVIVKEALANGRLTLRNSDPDFADKLAILVNEAERLGTTTDGLALAAVLAQPWADIVLSGAATPDQLESNLKALEVQWDNEAALTLSRLAEPPEIYWEKRSNLAWN